MNVSEKTINELYRQIHQSRLMNFDPDSKRILKAVMKVTGRNESEIFGTRRTSQIVAARSVAMFLTVELLGKSWSSVGTMYDKDHTTVMAAYRRVKERGRGRTAVNIILSKALKELAA